MKDNKDLEKAILRASRRFYRDVMYEGEKVGAFTNCTECDAVYNLYNPYLSEDVDDVETCALCSLLELVNVYEATHGQLTIN